jgi:hypothetical protein
MLGSHNPRERASEAARLLNNFLLDLVVGTRGLDIFELPQIQAGMTNAIAVGLNRLAISHLVVTLSKWAEFYRRYRAVLPPDVRDVCRSLHEEIERRGIREFRNKVVGHILDSSTNRPLTTREIDARLEQIFAGDRDHFMCWINNPDDNSFPNSVVGITQFIRDRLRSEYGLTDEEIL